MSSWNTLEKACNKQLAELGLADITGKAKAMIVQANFPEEIKYKLCKKCYCAMHLSNLAVVTLHGKTDTSYKPFNEEKPHNSKNLKIWGEAVTVSMGKNGKVGRGIPMFLLVMPRFMPGTVI